MNLFYDTLATATDEPPASLGAVRIPMIPVRWIGNSSADGLSIDIPAVIEYVRGELAKHPGTVYVGLNDAEGPLEETYSHTALNNESHPNWVRAASVHVGLLHELHAAFPGVLFAYWGRPNLPPFVDPKNPARWDQLSNENLARYTAGYLRAYEPLMRASGWLCPAKVYDDYEDGHKDANGNDTANAPALSYWKGDHAGAVAASAYNAVKFCRTHFPEKPCIPFVSAYYLLPAYSTVFRAIDPAVLIERQVKPCLDAGATGICVYSGVEWSLRMAASLPLNPAYDQQRKWFDAAYYSSNFVTDWANDPEVAEAIASDIYDQSVAALTATAAEIRRREPVEEVQPPPEVPATPTIEELARRVARLERWRNDMGTVTLSARALVVEGDWHPSPANGSAAPR